LVGEPNVAEGKREKQKGSNGGRKTLLKATSWEKKKTGSIQGEGHGSKKRELPLKR